MNTMPGQVSSILHIEFKRVIIVWIIELMNTNCLSKTYEYIRVEYVVSSTLDNTTC